jgi:hypothetical protein
MIFYIERYYIKVQLMWTDVLENNQQIVFNVPSYHPHHNLILRDYLIVHFWLTQFTFLYFNAKDFFFLLLVKQLWKETL